MKQFVDAFCKRYSADEKECMRLVDNMEEVCFRKGDFLVREGEINSSYYLIKEGIWRGYILRDGEELSVWFAITGETVFSSWGYMVGRPSPIYIEAMTDSTLYVINKPKMEEFLNSSIESANLGRKLVEQDFLVAEERIVATGAISQAKERYLDLLKRGKKVIYDSHENYPQDIFYKKIWMPLPLRWIVSKAFAVYEKTALPKFSAVISVTPQIVDRFLLSNKNSYLITNYPIIKGDDECSVKIRTNNKWIAVFAGSIQAPWVHENFIKAIQDTSFSFIMAGKVSEPAYIEKLKSLDRNNKLRYIGEKTQDEIFALYKDVSLGLAIAEYRPTEFNHEGSLGINKFFEYMRFGIPSICTDYTLWMPIIEKWRCSFPVNPNKLDDIIQVLHKIENNPDLLVEMGRRAREASVTEYNWEPQVPTLLKAYKAAMQ